MAKVGNKAKLRAWQVRKEITLTRYVKATTKEEAEAIAEDLGDIDARHNSHKWRATPVINPLHPEFIG